MYQPINNLRITKNYVHSSSNSTHATQRVAEVALDIACVNLMAEGYNLSDPAAAGQIQILDVDLLDS
jgi:hypothetical protein